jgi:hypothetical protein
VKFMLLNYLNPAIWDGLTEEERTVVFAGHDTFQKTANESGELVAALAMNDPTHSAVVRVRDGRATTDEGPYVESKEYLAGYYLVDCETRERALELAALVPDAAINVIEVRPVMFCSGLEM